jgi:amidase
MTRDLPSLIIMTRAVLETLPWNNDIDVIEMPWKDDVLQSVRNRSCKHGERNGKLVFGIMGCDKTVNPHPPVQRALKIVRDALLERGYEVRCYIQPILQAFIRNSRLLTGTLLAIILRRTYW